MMSAKKVAVIGAGVAGLCTVKSCLEEGFNVDCFEASSEVGGLWSYQDEEEGGLSTESNSVHGCTFMNSSKEISAFSDFVPPDTFPNFPRHDLVKEYLNSYAERFHLVERVKFRTRVIDVRRDDDPVEIGRRRWIVTSVDSHSSSATTETRYDAVAICVGLLSKANFPRPNGIENFNGEVIHSISYKTPGKFKGKNVAVVGIGNSAADIAVDLTHVASNVYLSTRRGAWIFHRSGSRGLPSDIRMSTRFLHACFRVIPRRICNWLMEVTLNRSLDHSLYGIRPEHKVLEHPPLINDELAFKLLNGSVQLKGDIDEFRDDGIKFQGDSEVTRIDSVIFATGFTQNFDFLSEERRLEVKDEDGVCLYKHIFPPWEESRTIGFVGLIATFGPSNPMMEMQSRYFSAVISGKIKLPSSEDMVADVNYNKKLNGERLLKSPRHIWYTDFLPYMDGLAETLGVKPRLWSMCFRDPVLFWYCAFGPFLSYQYRLEGPHANPNARNDILDYERRVLRPFRTSFQPIRLVSTEPIDE